MLKVFYSNKPEALAAQLQAHLHERFGLPPRDVFCEVQLIAASRPLEAWLKQQLAAHAGVVANLRTWLLQRFVEQLTSRAFPTGTLLDGPVIHDRLLARFLSDDLEDPVLSPVRGYLHGYGGTALALRQTQLAKALAGVFEEYLFSRREMLDAWSRGQPSRHDGGEALAAWQRRLWADLVADTTYVPPTALLRVAPQALTPDQHPLFVFGLSFVGTFFHELLAHLARAVDVYLYTLNPCMEFWEDLESVRDPRSAAARRAEPLPPGAMEEEDPFQLRGDPCRLLALWGRPGRESVRLLNQATAGTSAGIFVDPTVSEQSVLRRLQADLLLREPTRPTATPRASADDLSLLILRAPSQRSECQAVAARIWAMLGAAPGPTALRLDDIAVLIAAKDTERYVAPLLSSFREHHALPWQLVGVPYTLTSPVVEAALLLLELPLSRFTRAEVLRVLTHPVVAARFPSANASDWLRWIDAVGIAHGFSHRDHEGTTIDKDVLNWDQGLRRLALGAFLASGADSGEEHFELHGQRYWIAPTGTQLDEGVGALVLLARSLLEDARAMASVQRTAAQWAQVFERLLQTYLAPRDEAERRALEACLRVVRALRLRALGNHRLSYALAKELVREALESAGSSPGGAVTGGVRISSLVAARGIPARVTFIVGLDEGAFPSADAANALDLRRVHPRVGDASAREKDEYLFLETLLSTRDALVLSYVGRDERTGESRPASPIVTELLRVVDEGTLGRELDDASPHPLVRELALWRADSSAALDHVLAPSRMALEERALRAAGQALRTAGGPPPPGASARRLASLLEAPVREAMERAVGLRSPPAVVRHPTNEVVRVSLQGLRRYLECPLQGAASVRLGLDGDDEDEENLLERSGELFSSSALTSMGLLRRSFLETWRAAGGASLPADDAPWGLVYDREAERLIAQGRFPVGLFLEQERSYGLELLAAWRSAVATSQPSTHRRLQVVRFGPSGEHDACERTLPAHVVPLEAEGATPYSVRVELVGTTQPLVGTDVSLVLRRRDGPVRREELLKEVLKVWVDQVVLAAAGAAVPAAHRILLAGPTGCVELRLAPIEPGAAQAYLRSVLGGLLFADNEVLFPIEAVLARFVGGAASTFPRAVESLFARVSGGSQPCAGPVRRTEGFRVPEDDEAERLYVERLKPLADRLAKPAGAPSPGEAP
jgi:exodeoxyribonuclease V gamma subunit